MKHPLQLNKKAPAAVVSVAIIVIAVALFLSGYGQPANENTPQGSSSISNASQTEATVDLSPIQLNSIKIEPMGTYRFPVEKEAVGSIAFDEDLSVIQAESALIGAAATFELTSKELARVRDIYSTNIGVSQRELEQAISDQQTAEGALKAARDAVRALGKTDAEIDQIIASGKIEPGLRVRHSVAGLSTKWVVANVPEIDSSLVQVGQPVKVTVTAYPDRVFEGKVSKIYATVDPNTHRVTIRSKIADPKNELRPGMLANFVVRVKEPVEATAIPANSVVREGDGTTTAWVTTDRHRFLQRIVKIGLQKDGMYQVVKGLQRGELVVTDGGVFLSNMLQAPPSD